MVTKNKNEVKTNEVRSIKSNLSDNTLNEGNQLVTWNNGDSEY